MPRKKKTETRQAIEFAAILALIGLAMGALSLWRDHPKRAGVFAGAGLAALAVALLARPLWLRVFRLWMRFAEGLGWVMTRMLLTLFYYLVMTPFGVVRRFFGLETLDTKWKDGRTSYWIDKEPVEPTLERYAKRF